MIMKMQTFQKCLLDHEDMVQVRKLCHFLIYFEQAL